MLKRLLPVVIAAVTTAAIIAALATFVDFDRAWTQLQAADATWLALSGAAFFLALLLRSARFQWVLRRVRSDHANPPRATDDTPSVRFLDAFDLAALNNLANHLLPLRMGELLFVFLATRLGFSPERSLVALLFCRLGDLLGMLIVLLGASALSPSRLADGPRALLFVLFIVVLIVALFFAPLVRFGCHIAQRLLARWPNRVAQRGASFLDKVARVLPVLGSRRTVLLNVAASTLIWCAVMACFWCVMAALGLGMPVGDVAMGSAGAALLPLVPVNVFGTVGPLEAGWAAGFVAVGVAKSDAVTSGVIMHVLVIAVSALAAAFSMTRVGFDVGRQFFSWRKTRGQS